MRIGAISCTNDRRKVLWDSEISKLGAGEVVVVDGAPGRAGSWPVKGAAVLFCRIEMNSILMSFRSAEVSF